LEEIKIIASDPDEFFVIEALDFDLIELKRVGLIRVSKDTYISRVTLKRKI